MPRDTNKVFYWAAGNDAVPNETIRAAQFNTRMAEIKDDLNTPRPVSQGGTGAGNPAAAREALGAADASRTPYMNVPNTFTAPQTFWGNAGSNTKAVFGGTEIGNILFRDHDAAVHTFAWNASSWSITVGPKVFEFKTDGSARFDGVNVYTPNNKPTPQDIGAGSIAPRGINAPSLMRNTTAINVAAGEVIDGQYLREAFLVPAGGTEDGAVGTTGTKWRAMTACPTNRVALFIRAS